MKYFLAIVAAASFLFPAFAQEVGPDALVKSVTEEVLEIVRTDKELKAGNSRRAVELVEARVLPHFDFTHMTRSAMAKNWRLATPVQQKTLTEEFRELLVRTYSKALTEYKSQTIAYKPFAMKPGETDVTVRTEIRQSGGGKPIELDYDLEKISGAWKVYDIKVGGVSLVANYRDTFASEVSSGGVDGLIKALQGKNSQGSATAAARK